MSEDAGSVDTGNPAEATPAAEAPAEVAAPAPAATSWMEGVENPDTRAWAESKGLQNGTIENVLGSYHNLEKLMGADKAGRTVVVPGFDASPEERAEFYGKLGRPDDPKGYELPVPEGTDTGFSDWASNTFHTAGLSKEQASAVAEAWTEYVGSQSQQQQDAVQTARVDTEAALRKQWGAAYDQSVKQVDAAAGQLGLSDDELQAFNTVLGGERSMLMFHDIYQKIGDDKFDSGEVVKTNHLTPEQASQAMAALRARPGFEEAWLDRSHPDHKQAVADKAAIARQMAGLPA